MNFSLTDHQRLLGALQTHQSFTHPTQLIERVETHISSILLTGEYAYKIKKPVDFGFLDFSTLAKRKHYCEEELRLNTRTASDIYLSVVPINGSITHPQISGNGPTIEYAVKMRQFDQAHLLGRLLRQGKLFKPLIDELAEVISSFHDHASVCPDNSHFGNEAAVYTPVAQNIKIILSLLKDPQERLRLNRLKGWLNREHTKLKPVFRQRKAEGFIRECHGDLHLNNIAHIEGIITLFDGIEFSEQLRWIDIMSDLAFISMDLIDHDASPFAWRLINRYLEYSGDYQGLEVLRFYQVYRAMVRAKIACLRLDQSNLSTSQREDTIQQYKGYAELAEKLMIPQKPLLILTFGLSGSGKSWLSQQLLEVLPACRIRSDVERKRVFSSLLSDKQRLYSAEASGKTYQCLLRLAQQSLRSGYTTIVDAAFLKEAQREPFIALAKSIRCPAITLHTHANENILRQRILKRSAESGNVSDATLNVLESQITGYEHPSSQENLIEIDTGHPVDLNPVVHMLRTFV
jgi:aminoglycoside phosphotransferase family enzyme/predicted kinase